MSPKPRLVTVACGPEWPGHKPPYIPPRSGLPCWPCHGSCGACPTHPVSLHSGSFTQVPLPEGYLPLSLTWLLSLSLLTSRAFPSCHLQVHIPPPLLSWVPHWAGVAPARSTWHACCRLGTWYLAHKCVGFPLLPKNLRKVTSRRKGLFWLTGSEVPVHGHFALDSGPAGRQDIVAGSMRWSRASCLVRASPRSHHTLA